MSVTEDEIPRVEKLYCCGNSSQKEALYISKLDLGLGVFSLLCVLSFSIVFAGEPSLLSSIEHKGLLSDLKIFLRLSPFNQWSILVSLNLLIMVESGFAILLTFAAQQRNITTLRVWCLWTVIDCLLSISAHSYIATVSQAYILHIVLAIIVFLYRWYCFWIIWVLCKRTRAIQGGYENPSDDEFVDVETQVHPHQQEDKF